jgi:hypothetical protein
LPRATAQRGAAAGQSVFVAHATQRFVSASQIGSRPAQSLATLQPTHAPLATSQSLLSPEHAALLVQAA